MCVKRTEETYPGRPNVGGISVRSRSDAPSGNGCVVNGRMTKANNKRVPPPPPFVARVAHHIWEVRHSEEALCQERDHVADSLQHGKYEVKLA